jgi:hypothetical protein
VLSLFIALIDLYPYIQFMLLGICLCHKTPNEIIKIGTGITEIKTGIKDFIRIPPNSMY